MRIEQVKENVRKMATQNAPMEDIDGFIQAAGYSVEDIRSYKPLPKINEPHISKYDVLDKAKYMGRAASEGMTLGLGDIVAGITNIPANYGAGNFENPVRLFKEGRKDFVNEQNDFAQEHPYLNTAGELAGGLFTGIGGAGKTAATTAAKAVATTAKNTSLPSKLYAIGKPAAKEGFKFGGLYGAGSGLTEDATELSPLQGLFGAATGAGVGGLGGAAFNLGIYPIWRGANKGFKFIKKTKANYDNRSYNAVHKVGSDKLHKAVDDKVALLDIADEPLIHLAEGVKLKDPKASQTFRDYGDYRRDDQVRRLGDIIDDSFGREGYSRRIEKMDDATYEASAPFYKKAIYGSDGKGVYIKSPFNIDEMEYINKVYGTTGFKNEVRNLPYNHMRVADYAKQILDDDISKAVKNEAHNKVRNLTALKKGYLSKIDAENPLYQQARGIIEHNEHLKQMLDMGKKFNTGSVSERQFDLNGLSKTEQKYYRYGVREKLLENFNRAKSDKINLTNKVFDKDTLRRIELIDIPNYRRMNAKIERERTAMENVNRILSGSQTKERDMSVGQTVLNPKSSFFESLTNKINRFSEPVPAEVARMMTDPGYLFHMRQKAIQGDLKTAQNLGYYNFNVMRAAGPLARQGEPDARVSSKSWNKIKSSPDYRTYEAIPHIREVYSKGDYYGPTPSNKIRKDNITNWHWFQTPKNNLGLQIGEDRHGRLLYNINPKVRDTVVPGFNPRGVSLTKNSIADKKSVFKPSFSMSEFLEILRKPQYTLGRTGGISGNIIYQNTKKNKEDK